MGVIGKKSGLPVEGSPAAQMVALISNFGHNKDVTIEVARVTAPLPDMKIMLQTGDEDEFVLDREELIISGAVIAANPPAGAYVIVIGDDDTDKFYVMDTAN
ncbi:hypothetical protein SC499_20195 [Peribacillus simplex]|uniref:hypothetical protein n=1 Tax=Peribacillus simplex TaxID=1478 RepID=UPI00298E145D|nr:hypothetical protein [Peribacillus simplex]MDW7616971.1 hypothetical protein [Peribacillus simplex]